MTTLVPRPSGRTLVASPLIVGAGTKVKVLADVPVPLTVATLTFTAPVPRAKLP